MTARLRRRYVFATLVVLVLLFGAAGYLLVPGLARSALEQQLASQLGRTIKVGTIAVHPYRLGITLSQLQILEADGSQPMVAIGELDAGVSPASLFRLAPVVNHLRITAPTVHIARLEPQRFNFSDILERIAARPKSGAPVQFSINNIELTQGTIVFDDAVTRSQHRIEQLSLSLPSVSNIRHDVDRTVDPALSARIDGSPIELKARTKPFASSLDTVVDLQVDGIDLPRYLGFVPVTLQPRIASGTLGGAIEFAFSKQSDAAQQIRISGRLTIDQLRVLHPDGHPAFAAARVAVALKNIDPVDALIDLDSIEITSPEVYATHDRGGQIDLVDLFVPAGPAKTAGEIHHGAVPRTEHPTTPTPTSAANAEPAPSGAKLKLGLLRIDSGTVHYRDDALAKPFETTLTDLQCEITGLATAEAAPAKLRLQFSLAPKQNVTLAGEASLAAKQASVHLEVHDVALAPLAPLLGEHLRARIEDGIFDSQTDASVDWGAAPLRIKVEHLSAGLDRLRVKRPEERTPVLALEHLAVTGGSFDLAARALKLESVTVHGLAANVIRDAGGTLNLATLVGSDAPVTESPVAVQSAAEPSARPVGAAPGFSVEVGALTYDGGTLHYADANLPEKTAVQLDKITLSAEHIGLAPGARIPFKLSALANRKGRLDIAGDVVPAPLAISAQVSMHQFPLAALQSYAPQRLNVTLASADLTMRGRVRAALGSGLDYHFSGALSVTDFAALDRVTGADFLTWKSFDIATLSVDTAAAGQAPVVKVGDVVLTDLYSRLIIYPDARLNVQDIMASPGAPGPKSLTTPGAEEPAAPPAANAPAVTSVAGNASTATLAPAPSARAGAAPVIRLKSITLNNGAINFTDNFVKPNYSTAISALNGTVSSVASDSPSPADVALKGSLEGNGDLEISGKVNPLAQPLYLELTASATDIELTRLSAYAIKYAGYNIDKGKLSMKVKYHIENNQLSAENHLFLDQLTFGEHVENTTATKLPVLLAVSLLKNSRGEIDINLPVSGSLSDPQFSIGGVIVRVILNLLEKALVSPFALLSSVGAGGSDDLGYVEFAPGEATLSATAKAKIEKLAGVLADRPALKLDIIGRADRHADTEQARNARLAARVKGQKFREALGAGETVPFDQIVVTPQEYPHYLESLYKDMDFDKPKNVVGLTKSLSVPEMEALIRANMPVDDDDLRTLAYRRASAVRAEIETSGKIPGERIFLVAPKLDDGANPGKDPPSRVEFGLH